MIELDDLGDLLEALLELLDLRGRHGQQHVQWKSIYFERTFLK